MPECLKKRKSKIEELKYKAYQDGLRAAYSGKTAAECPYRYNTEEGQQWMIGHQDGGGKD